MKLSASRPRSSMYIDMIFLAAALVFPPFLFLSVLYYIHRRRIILAIHGVLLVLALVVTGILWSICKSLQPDYGWSEVLAWDWSRTVENPIGLFRPFHSCGYWLWFSVWAVPAAMVFYAGADWLVWVALAAPPEPAKNAGTLIAHLESPYFVKREDATRDLIEMGYPAMPALRRARADTTNAETCQRLDRIIAAIVTRGQIEGN